MNRPFLALFAAALVAAPAFAATERLDVTIEFAVANLDAPASLAAEYASIEAQVEDWCAAEHADLPFGGRFAVQLCTDRTLNAAVRKIDHDGLTALHAVSR